MFLNIVKNPIVKASTYLLLCLAYTHFFVYIIYILITQDVSVFNVFNIIGLPLFFPHIAENPWTNVVTVIVYIGGFIFFYRKVTSKK